MTATSTHVGRFRFGAATDRWWWSDHMFLIHGMQPGDVVPTRELLLTHVQRDDRAVVGEALDRCLEEPDPRACDYCLVDMSGAAHRVVLAVAGDGDGDLTGFLVDVTAAHDALLAERVNAELTLALESHAAIDQAKGILMLTYGVDEDAAFGILKQSSQRHNTRLRELAGRVVRTAAVGLESIVARAARRGPVRGRPSRTRRRRARVAGTSTCTPSAPPTSRSCASRVRSTCRTGTSWPTRSRMAMLGAADVRRVTVDVRGLGRIGPAAVDVLTAALRRSTAHGITLTIVGGGLGDTAASAAAHRSSIASRS